MGVILLFSWYRYKDCLKKKEVQESLIEPELHLEGGKCANFLLLNKKENLEVIPVGQLTANIFYNPEFSDIQSWHMFLQFLNQELKLCDVQVI